MQDVAVVVAHPGAAPEPAVGPAHPRRRPRWPGIAALVLGLLTVVGHIAGHLLLVGLLPAEATITSIAATVLGAVAVVLGLVAAIARLGRTAGVAGLVLGVLANPLVLVYLLDLLEGR